MADKNSNDEKDGEKAQSKTAPSTLEWLVAAAGSLLVAAALGYISYRAVTVENTPPNLTVEIESVTPISAGFLVKFHVANSGEETAAAVNVEGTLKDGETTAESGTATIDYVPSRSERKGGILFEKNPQNYQMQIRAVGYANP
ncbi:MAG: TIGR02588 family protein [Acidobacteriota bacterium]|nr:TIGR02588 family protein [Acidobacteriota bacterium]